MALSLAVYSTAPLQLDSATSPTVGTPVKEGLTDHVRSRSRCRTTYSAQWVRFHGHERAIWVGQISAPFRSCIAVSHDALFAEDLLRSLGSSMGDVL